MVDAFVKQLDGCTYVVDGVANCGGKNCTCAGHAMWMYHVSQGRVKMTSCEVRRDTGDRAGGTNLHQMQDVSDKHGVARGTLWAPGRFDDMRRLAMTNLYIIHAGIGYGPLVGTPNDCFGGGFRGAHDIVIKGASLAGVRYGDGGADRRRAGIPSGWQTMSWSKLRQCTNALPLEANGPTLAQDYGDGYVFALISPRDAIPEVTRWRVHIDAPDPPRFWLWNMPFGIKRESVTKATYICSLTRLKSPAGVWYGWYRIISKADGSHTDNAGLFLTSNRYVDAVRI
jgi:hypothetical protein